MTWTQPLMRQFQLFLIFLLFLPFVFLNIEWAVCVIDFRLILSQSPNFSQSIYFFLQKDKMKEFSLSFFRKEVFYFQKRYNQPKKFLSQQYKQKKIVKTIKLELFNILKTILFFDEYLQDFISIFFHESKLFFLSLLLINLIIFARLLLVSIQHKNSWALQAGEINFTIFFKNCGNKIDLGWCTQKIFDNFSCFCIDFDSSSSLFSQGQKQSFRKVHQKVSKSRAIIQEIKQRVSCCGKGDKQFTLFIKLQIITKSKEIRKNYLSLTLLWSINKESNNVMYIQLREND